jgi:hypothetical protein
MLRCDCCGNGSPDTHVSGGAMHFRCWDERHSDPTGPWPPEHACQKDVD